MGGDHAPAEIVAGAVLAARDGIGHMILVGDEAQIRPLLTEQDGRDIDVVHAPSAVAMDAAPAHALRGADETSLGMAIKMLKEGRADAVDDDEARRAHGLAPFPIRLRLAVALGSGLGR